MDVKSKQLFEQALSANGHSLTAARTTIFELLNNREPQSINELQKRGLGRFDRVTLYRTLELFESLGIVKRVYFGWKYKFELSDKFTRHHHHLICLGCDKLISINEPAQLEKIIEELAASKNFRATNHSLEIQGYCLDCSNKFD